ncbi:MAG: DUF1553 domain-containing protein [Planctomycetaceae bacterium]|jgi:hypothetical protein|nr:DUF1553 domain-containing protein [Planctomycetaceae bacterium]
MNSSKLSDTTGTALIFHRGSWLSILLLSMLLPSGSLQAESPDESPGLIGQLTVEPSSVELTHRRRPHSLIVSARTPLGQTVDLTGRASFRCADEQVARVSALGLIEPIANGTTRIEVQSQGLFALVVVTVKLPAEPRRHSFRDDVMPVLSKSGCNQGSCHGYSLGKNGFKLSLRGSDPVADFQSLTAEFFGRRINQHNPTASLLLTKPLGEVPHKGGALIEPGSLRHRLMLGWIREGARPDEKDAASFRSLSIYPRRVVIGPRRQQQLQVVAHYSDGSRRDVTRLTTFSVNTQKIATVTDEGLVSAEMLGETAVSARFERTFATAEFLVLEPREDFEPTPVPSDNLVDRFITRKLNALNIKPSAIADDATYLRRLSIDLAGIQPTPEELHAFVSDSDPAKRAKMIETLFSRSEFVDQWSLKWGDLLQNSRGKLSDPAVFTFREWLRGAVESNLPLDEFARQVLLGRGGASDSPTAAFFAVSNDTHDTLQRTTQVFCGVRMLCARCHPHPFENWTQADYYGLFSFFNQVGTKTDARLPGVRNAKAVVINLKTGFGLNPRSGQPQPPRFLGGTEPKLAAGVDRRESYARWLTSKDNPFFARSLANRIWSYFFHRGIIDPVDDLRSTNPPVNPELLDSLAADFVAGGYDMRRLMRTIVQSRTYQRSSQANATNVHDDANFSRFVPRRLPAETLLDCLVQATGVPEAFGGAPAGFTAKQLPDANIQSDFLKLFGKPQRMEACECERDTGSNMLQALHFINGKSIISRVSSPAGRVATLVKAEKNNAKLVEKLYLWSLCRRPTAKEQEVSAAFFKSYADKRLEAAQDFMWALLNSREFMLVQ